MTKHVNTVIKMKMYTILAVITSRVLCSALLVAQHDLVQQKSKTRRRQRVTSNPILIAGEPHPLSQFIQANTETALCKKSLPHLLRSNIQYSLILILSFTYVIVT